MPRHVKLVAPLGSIALAGLTACSSLEPQDAPEEVFAKTSWQHRPAWAKQPPGQQWWTSYGSAALNADINRALAQNPSLAVLAARVEKAGALTKQARAASYPTINAGGGLQTGRAQDPDFGPYDLQPYTARGQISWEVDLTGKLAAARRSAEDSLRAAFWDLTAARLLVATELADAHFTLGRLNEEIALQRRIVGTYEGALANLRRQQQAGIVRSAETRTAEAEVARAQRDLLDLQRLASLTQLKRATLRGETSSTPISGSLPGKTPAFTRSTADVLRHRPDLLAAEARVRAAFELSESARLNLLPSFSLGAGAMGGTSSLTNRFNVWQAQVGPSLDIPIYDPVRLAQVDVRRAETKEASAQYRDVALKAFEEVEGAYLTLTTRQNQLAQVDREVQALESALGDAKAQRSAGTYSDLEVLAAERRLLQARRARTGVKHQKLAAHLALVRALGG